MGWLAVVVILAAGTWQQQAHGGDNTKCNGPQGVIIFQHTPWPSTARPLAHTKFRRYVRRTARLRAAAARIGVSLTTVPRDTSLQRDPAISP